MHNSTTARGVFPPAVVAVVVVAVEEVVARSAVCGDEAKCWVLAAAGPLVSLSTEAADEDNAGEERCRVSFPQAEGGSAVVLMAEEAASEETLQDFGTDVETTWTGRGEDGEAGGAAAATVGAGVVSVVSDLVVVVESSGASGVGFTHGGDAVVVATSVGQPAAVRVGSGTEGREAKGAWEWAGRGGVTPGGDVANGGAGAPVSGSSVGQ